MVKTWSSRASCNTLSAPSLTAAKIKLDPDLRAVCRHSTNDATPDESM